MVGYRHIVCKFMFGTLLQLGTCRIPTCRLGIRSDILHCILKNVMFGILSQVHLVSQLVGWAHGRISSYCILKIYTFVWIYPTICPAYNFGYGKYCESVPNCGNIFLRPPIEPTRLLSRSNLKSDARNRRCSTICTKKSEILREISGDAVNHCAETVCGYAFEKKSLKKSQGLLKIIEKSFALKKTVKK